MSWYDDRVLPTLTNLACATKPTRKQREKLVPLASGDILEIGFGSGLNLPFYNRDQVKTLRGLEPSAGMLRLAEKRISDSGINVDLIELPGEEIILEPKRAFICVCKRERDARINFGEFCGCVETNVIVHVI